MAVTEATAARAVTAWQLSGGVAKTWTCGCRFWMLMRLGTARQVYRCPGHRPAWQQIAETGTLAHADA